MSMRSVSALVLFAVALVLAGCGADRYPANVASAAGLPGLPAGIAPIGPNPGAGPGEGHTHERQIRNPFEGDQGAREQGRQLFVQMNCSGCHGGRAGGGMGPSLRDPDWIYGNSPSDIFSSIVQGRAHGMPAWGLRLPSDEIWKLVSYIQSLGTPQEPDAPSPAPLEAPPMSSVTPNPPHEHG